ncbi:putative 2-aminoethylphosphonate ABC transporter permease subunit [Paraburkholderia fungorum]|uniref:putative 2-aminoethylphosphonate ABC transporter permease subunit n=1 Tax=Paraburkholderia fungorum TaxID=134537 RepID=UPI000486384E|nr:putative 2-aminoethylphosphonate ABC transporter permease subunit [Paraburkholderia fungorum]MBB5540098.1 iron(III) transport system permease protein [Paraburkholderia fungorum]PNE52919.1 putative 2-aminoethylphosphonate ABC transporter permease subunit [Paraburkholderia fungorum]
MSTTLTEPGKDAMLAEVRQRTHWQDRIGHAGMLLMGCFLLLALLAPLTMVIMRCVEDRDGRFVGLANFTSYFRTPALWNSVGHSLFIAVSVTAITIPLAFTFAYALTRSCMPLKGLVRNIALIPLLAPTLLSAVSFIYWFGNAGLLRRWTAGHSIYGAPGIIASLVYAAMPHVLMILITALSLTDARLYEAADAMGTSRLRKFFTITLPGAKYGLISATMVVFTICVNDFGVPIVIGGSYNVLSTDVYKLIVGLQDFNTSAVVSILLLLPALLSFATDFFVRRKQRSLLGARSVPYEPKRSRGFDLAMLAYCSVVCFLMMAIVGISIYGSFVHFWPYNLTLGLSHYRMGLIGAGIIGAYKNSLEMAALVATAGTMLVFGGAYLIEKTRGMDWLRPVINLCAVLPMGVPGLVLGIGYIFFFNHPANPLNFLYGSLPLLAIVTIIHYYSSSHLTAITALKQIDNEFEAVSASLKVPFYATFFRVTVPVCLPAILEISRYFFINGMTTISAVAFLYSPGTQPASVAILNLDEAGQIGPAAAMATLIVVTSTLVCVLYALVNRFLLARTQRWRYTSRNR